MRLRTGVRVTRILVRSDGGLIESPSKTSRPETVTPVCSVTVVVASTPLTVTVEYQRGQTPLGSGRRAPGLP